MDRRLDGRRGRRQVLEDLAAFERRVGDPLRLPLMPPRHRSSALPRSFDEVHFGGFARKYIKQTFFMDVHPPLAKLLITLAALVGRFDGDFDFKDIGKYVVSRLPLPSRKGPVL